MSESFKKLVEDGDYTQSMHLWDAGWSKESMVADSARGILHELGFLVDAAERIAAALEEANRIAKRKGNK